jgi:hypothetical protein
MNPDHYIAIGLFLFVLWGLLGYARDAYKRWNTSQTLTDD